MEKQNSKNIGLINGIVLLIITLCALFLGNELNQRGFVQCRAHIGSLISIFSFVQGHLISRAR